MLDCPSMKTTTPEHKRLEGQLGRASRSLAKAQARRNELIRMASDAGMTRRAIADCVGVSFQRVHQIVQRDRDAS